MCFFIEESKQSENSLQYYFSPNNGEFDVAVNY